MKNIAFSILTMVSAGSMFAQRPGPPPHRTAADMDQWRVEHLASSLSLTDVQKEKAASVYKASHAATASLRDSMKQAHEALRTEVQKNDTVGIDKASLAIGNLMAQQMSAESKADAAVRQTLTADQQTKFDRMHTAGRGLGGPGGPPGPPRPDHAHHPQAPAQQ